MPKDITDPIEIDSEVPILLDLTHLGDGHFSVKFSSLSGGKDETLVNTIGHFDGRVLAAATPGSYVFEISYDKGYSLEHAEIGEVNSVPISLDKADPYVLPLRLPGPVKINLTTRAESHVGVSLRAATGRKVSQLINEIGPTQTDALIRQQGEGFIFFDIEGSWTAEISDI